MTALASDRNTLALNGETLNLGVAAAVKIFVGSLVSRDASGNAIPGRTATTDRGMGRSKDLYDNSSGVADDIIAEIERGVFKFANSSAADAIADADIGNDCYIVDDQTVAKTNGTNTRSIAGKIFKVDSDGVWVDFR